MTSPLQDRAMLASLSISQWGARKYDATATKQVNATNNATNAGRFNKCLIDPEALRPLQQIEGAARQHHYSLTSPWGEKNERILPGTLFMEWSEAMDQFSREFDKRVRVLEADYPRLVQEARKNVGNLYNPSDYPAHIASRFSFRKIIEPISSANDFRVQLSSEYVNTIRREIEEAQNARMSEATKHALARARELIENIHETCSKDKPRIFESMMEKAEHLVRVLPALNINNDPALSRVVDDMKQLITPTKVLKDNPVRRAAVARTADQILASMASWA